jgi:Rps23 Pro-64 3,4-dihydroxylase Tpa1-like proline 4-hydroxylase
MSRGFRLNPDMDWEAAAAAFQRNGRVSLPAFLEEAGALRLREHLIASEAWRLVLNAGAKVYEIDRLGQQALTDAQWKTLDGAVAAAARQGFQYRFETIRVPDDSEERQDAGLLGDLATFLSSLPVLERLSQVTGASDLTFADAQATSYGPGHFLTVHDDDVEGKNRRAAYVLGLTPDWRAEYGGLLMFHGEDGHIARGLVPAFNTLNIFRVPQPHSVSCVAPFAPEPRISVTGWLRAL